MSIKLRLCVVALFVATLGILVIPPVAKAANDDCRVERPQGRSRQALATGPSRDALSRKLADCGSVLDPPRVGDSDLVDPAPRTGDPINIHPGTHGRSRP